MIKFVFLDLDDTILNFAAGEANALSHALSEIGIQPTQAILDRYHLINLAHWELLEEGRLTREEVLVQRYEQLFRELGVSHSGAANVWEPKSINGGTPKYSVSLIIPKSDTKTVAKIKAAIEAAYQEGQSKLKGNSKSVPPLAAIKTPLRDGDIERPDDPAYANAYFINANSATAPGIVDADRNPVLTRSEVYSGVYGRASINLYAFNSNGNKGIACGLNNLQLIRAGEPLGGKASAESDFATDADDDFLA